MTVRPYVDRPIADRDAATQAASVAARNFGLDAPTLVRHAMNSIHRCGDVVLRVSTPTARASVSIELADSLQEIGIPVATAWSREVVEVNGFSVTAWELIESAGSATDWCAVGEIVRRLHTVSRADLPSGIPLPSPADFPWWEHERLLDEVVDLVDDDAAAGLTAAIERHAGWREHISDDAVVCHGDVHANNIVMSSSGPVLLDWDLLCLAPPCWDHAPLATWHEVWGGEPEAYGEFARGYGAPLRDEPNGATFAELRLVSATLMRLQASRNNSAATPEARRRLAHWRGDGAAPTWLAQ